MVDVEAYQTEGSKDFNEFSCGECGTYHNTEEEAEECCREEAATPKKDLVEEEAKEFFMNDEEREAKADRELDEHWAKKKKIGVE